MSQLVVGISDFAVSRDPQDILATHALGSCIAVAIHDPVSQVAGLLHFMLPDSTLDAAKAKNNPCMFADTGLPVLFHGTYGLGAVKQRLIVTVLGGAQVLDSDNTFNIGKRNYLALRKILWKAGVMIHQEEVGGTLPRSVRMEVGTGRIVVFHGREEREITHKRKGVANGV
jgi:chemotaxis protein CheD